MTRYNVRDTRSAAFPIPAGVGPITAKTGKPKTNHQGGTGYVRTPQSEAFLTATTSLDITADTFYQGGDARVDRYVKLIRNVAATDPQWTAEFLAWLRGPGNIRTAAIVGAVEAARAMLAANIPGGRQIIDSVCQRADEPGEVVAYHLAKHGRNLPKPVKRGVADAAARLYSERSLLKYDTASHAIRFGDVIEMTHPAGRDGHQSAVFKAAIDRRHGRTEELGDHLPTLMANRQLRFLATTDSRLWLDPAQLDQAGMTWEDVLSLAGSKIDKAALWEAIIPSMGYMALLRNLRNFDQAGVSDTVAATVAARLADPDQVAKSRQLPMRFLSAYRTAPSLRWAWPLEQALDHAVRNIPQLDGRALILVDTSGSMGEAFGKDGTLRRWDAAVMFGLALARRCVSPDVFSYSNTYFGGPGSKVFMPVYGESLLKSISRWKDGGFFIGAGTDTIGAVRRHFAGHDRVVILTDEQHGRFGLAPGTVSDAVPETTPLYVFNLAGYRVGSIVDDPNRVTLGGLTDAMFRLIPTVESGTTGQWPWETTA